MTLYIKIPTFNVSLHTLEKDVSTRIDIFLKIFKCDGDIAEIEKAFKHSIYIAENLDCFIEDSKRDTASHFLLRLSGAYSSKFEEFFVCSEIHLFKYRLHCGGAEHLLQCITHTHCQCLTSMLHLNEGSKQYKFLHQVADITCNLLQYQEMIQCTEGNCCSHFVKVQWTMVKNLVAYREVKLYEGFAYVSCKQIVSLLCCLYEDYLRLSIEQMREVLLPQLTDERIIFLIRNCHLQLLHRRFHNRTKDQIFIRRAHQVKDNINRFPLCMKQIYLQLNKRRRLSHHTRFIFSLFLKDIGLPLEESMHFWQSYYSLMPKSGTGCQHTWQGTQARKYIYALRHMYGLEGRKVPYTSHSCAALQSVRGQPCESGICPFVSASEEESVASISGIVQSQTCLCHINAIGKCVRKQLPSLACAMTLTSNINHQTQCDKKPFGRFRSLSFAPNKKEALNNRVRKFNSLSFRNPKNVTGEITNRGNNCVSICCGRKVIPELTFNRPSEYFLTVNIN